MDAERAARIDAHLYLVHRIAVSLHRQMPMCNVDDLVSAGHEGLVDAALRYDPEHGTSFAQYAYLRIRGAMFDALRREQRASRAFRRATKELEVAQAILDAAAEHPTDHRAPLEERVATVRAIVDRAAVAVSMVSMFHGEEADGSSDVPDTTADDPVELVTRADMRRLLALAIEELPADERALVEAVYFEDEQMSDHARRVGVHKSTICRRHARAIDRLAVALGARPPLPPPLDSSAETVPEPDAEPATERATDAPTAERADNPSRG